MARLASLCAVLCAVVALIACAHAGASNVANGDLTSMSGFNLIAGYCFTSGGLLDWSIYTGGIPVSSPLSLYFFNEASWQKAAAANLPCTSRISYAQTSILVQDNVPNNASIASGMAYFALANCNLSNGWYVQYHLNATNTCAF